MNNQLYKQLYNICDVAWRKRYVLVLPIVVFAGVGLVVGLMSAKKHITETRILIHEPTSVADARLTARSKRIKREEELQSLLHSHVLHELSHNVGKINSGMNISLQKRKLAKFSRKFKISILDSDIVKLAYYDKSPEQGKEIITTLTKLFIHARIAQIDPTVKRLEEDIVLASSELASLRARYKDGHSGVMVANRKLDLLKSDYERMVHLPSLNQFTSTGLASYQQDKDTLLDSSIVPVESSVEVSAFSSKAYGRVKLITPPSFYVQYSLFSVVYNLISGLLAGVFLGVGLVTVLVFSDSSIRQVDHLFRICRTPVLGRLSKRQ